MSRIFCLALPLLLATACGGATTPAEPPPVEATAVDPRVERAVLIANAIKAEPARADAILQENGISRADFEALLFQIAEDPALAASYVEKRAR